MARRSRGRFAATVCGGTCAVISLAITLTACAAGTVRVPDDPIEPDASAICTALVASLPDHLDEGARRDIDPDLPYVAAWGDPAILLRCGVAKPAQYEPTSMLLEVNDVAWLPVDGVGGRVFFATGRAVWIRVDVPEAYTPEANVLTEFASAVAAVPLAE